MKNLVAKRIIALLAVLCTLLLCGCTIETAEQYRERIGETSYATIESSGNSSADNTGTSTAFQSDDSQSDDSQTTSPASGNNAPTAAPTATSPDFQSDDSQSDASHPNNPTTTVSPSTSPPVAEVCVLSVDCSTILDNMSNLKKGKEEFVGDGTLFPATSIPYVEGDTVFDLTLRALGTQLDYTSLKYVRGIKQIYEKNCGSQSGWIYFVNGQKLGVSSAACVLKPGDIVEWRFTCDGGKDLN